MSIEKEKRDKYNRTLKALESMYLAEGTITHILTAYGLQPRISIVLQQWKMIEVNRGKNVKWIGDYPTLKLAREAYDAANSDAYRNIKARATTSSNLQPDYRQHLLSETPTEELAEALSRRIELNKDVRAEVFETLGLQVAEPGQIKYLDTIPASALVDNLRKRGYEVKCTRIEEL